MAERDENGTKQSDDMVGYRARSYVEALSEIGSPIALIHSGGWLLKRPVPGFSASDAMGLYPLFVCRDWAGLAKDLQELGQELVALSLVTDPFGPYDEPYLRQCFPDRAVPFKQHYVVEFGRPLRTFVDSLHRRKAEKASYAVSVEICANPIEMTAEWVQLYGNLVKRHNIRGIRAFSPGSISRQLAVPGAIAFRARYEDQTVGGGLCYVDRSVAYFHWAAFTDVGYQLLASFALFWAVLDYFSSMGLKWLDVGGGAGLDCDGTDGLSRFKRGWATGCRTVYFCGRILDPAQYAEISTARGLASCDYFPAYRRGEFG